jgi:chromate transporter
MSPPPLRSLAAVFARHGNTTFGGGSATIATLHGQVVMEREWVSQQQFDLSYALSRLTPGTNLLAFSTAIGWLVRGWSGALVVLLASSIPCSILAVFLTVVYESLTHHPMALIALRGALAAAVGVVAATAWTLIRPHIKTVHWLNIAVFSIGAFLLATVFHFTPIRMLLLAAVLGVALPTEKRTT